MNRSGASTNLSGVAPLIQNRHKFVDFPPGWYVFSKSSRIKSKPVAKNTLSLELLCYRDQHGEPVVMDRRCSHLGADLGSGKIVKGEIECPFHGWRYNSKGQCTQSPGCQNTPKFAKQKTYPIIERHGKIYFFNRSTALFPLPFFIDERPEEFAVGPSFKFRAHSTWHMLQAHSFDISHLYHVHDRRITSKPKIDIPQKYARRNSYTAQILGANFRERLLRVIVGKEVKMTITAFGGSMVALAGKFRRAESHFILNTYQLDNEYCEVIGTVYCRKSKLPLIGRFYDSAKLYMKYLFTKGYLAEEASEIGNPKYDHKRFVESDSEVVKYFDWICELPGFKVQNESNENFTDSSQSLPHHSEECRPPPSIQKV